MTMIASAALVWDGWGGQIGWALAHFLWPGLLAAALLLVVLKCLPGRSRQERGLGPWPALVAMAILPAVTAVLSMAADPATQVALPPEKGVAELVDRLGSNEWKERDQAQRELVKMGQPALRYLRSAAHDPDLERAARVQAATNEIWAALQTSFRGPDYSLGDQPQRIKPRTLDKAQADPGQAMVLGKLIDWCPSTWQVAYAPRAGCIGTPQEDKSPSFVVAEPFTRKVWTKYLDVPVDSARYPILVMTYRAVHTAPLAPNYMLYLDDSSGPDYGGLVSLTQSDIIPDGKTHTLTYDTRLSKPLGDFVGLGLGVECDQQGPATFELVDLRFESDQANPPAVGEGKPIKVKVAHRGEGGKGETIPAKAAEVTVDAEWSNWARSALADADGVASVAPLKTADGRHMLRVSKKDFVTTEIRDISPDQNEVSVVLEPAATYGGIVQDEQGQPLANASVNVTLSIQKIAGQRVCSSIAVLTDEKGRWNTPPLPKNAGHVDIALAHPVYTHGAQLCPAEAQIEALQAGKAVLAIKSQVEKLNVTVVDQQGEPVAGALVRALSGGIPQRSDKAGKLTVTVQGNGATLLVQHEEFAPLIVSNSPDQGKIVLEKGRRIVGRMVDVQGKPAPGVLLEGLDNRVFDVATVNLVTDKEGRFEWAHAPSVNPMLKSHSPWGKQEVYFFRGEQESYEMKLSPAERGESGKRDPGYDPLRNYRPND